MVPDQALALFERFDVLLAPATPFPATPIGQVTTMMGGRSVSVRANLGLYTQPISFIGLPVLAAPIVRAGRMPVGVQLIAPPLARGEDILFRIAAQLEAEVAWWARSSSSTLGFQSLRWASPSPMPSESLVINDPTVLVC